MGEKGTTNRQRIVDTADQLFYHQGYNQTSFTDIAQAAGLSRGNFYYYFKTKDDILAAVIDHRLDGIRNMLEQWDQEYPNPRDRLKRFAAILDTAEEDILRYGCPMGSLNAELSKTQRPQQTHAAEMFDVFRQWLERQLRALGHETDAPLLALRLLAIPQGVSLIGSVYQNREFLREEKQRLEAWIDQL